MITDDKITEIFCATDEFSKNTTVQRNFPIRSADHYRSHSEDVLV